MKTLHQLKQEKLATKPTSIATRSHKQAMYRRADWKRLRREQLANEPLCRSCKAQGKIRPATVADHLRPHRGNEALFTDPANLQSLCSRCHNVKSNSE